MSFSLLGYQYYYNLAIRAVYVNFMIILYLSNKKIVLQTCKI